MRNFLLASAGAAALLLFVANPGYTQAPISPAPIPNVELPVLITNASQTAATVNSAQQTNTYHKGVVCTMNMSSHTNSPSTTIAVQGYNPVSNSYQTLGTSAAVTADATPQSVMVYPGVEAASPPSGLVGSSFHLPRRWRVTQVVGGTTPIVNATVGCVLLN